MSMITLYFLVKLDSLISFLGWNLFFILIFLVVLAGFALSYHIEQEQGSTSAEDHYAIKKNKMISKMKQYGIVFVIVLFLFKAVPTTKEIAFIYIVGTMTQAESSKRIGEEAVKIPEKALQILNYHLDEYMQTFVPANKINRPGDTSGSIN